MRCIIYAASAAFLLAAGPAAAQDYSALDLLKPCTEADNDARWGDVAELECEQYILGFIQALQASGDTTVCAPVENTEDEARWAYMRWIHADYTKRKALSASDALLATLRENFTCGN